MSRRITPLLLCSLVLSTACNSEGPTDPVDGSSIRASKSVSSPVTRPAGGTCAPEITVVAPFPGPGQPVLSLRIGGVCELKHLGRTALDITETVDFSTGVILNSTTYTAANGDVVNSTFLGTVLSPPGPDAVFEGTETYVSGTGRFVGVSGSSSLKGTAHLNGLTGAGEYTTTGTITF